MTFKTISYLFLCFLFSQSFLAQEKKEPIIMDFHLVFDKNPLEINKKYVSETKDSLEINTFKFYISNISIQFADNTNYSEENSYHLLDIENPNSLKIPLKNYTEKSILKITFTIGVDSLANVSGAMSGDLDPTNGMYWAWQSGYINMKIQGISKSCKTRKNAFDFHIGGYLKPYYASRKITLEPKNNRLNIKVDLAKLFSKISLSETNSIMIPGKQAMEIADKSIQMFSLE